jgi:hypothetical protein
MIDEPIAGKPGSDESPLITTPPMQSPADYPRPPNNSVPANDDPLRFVIPVNPSVWAIAAGYLGLFSVLCVFAPFSLIAGILALKDLKANPNKTGRGRALFGIIMGVIGTGTMIGVAVLSLLKAK